MFKNPSLVTRIGVGKVLGLAIGLVGFISLPFFAPDADLQLRWGILLWYTTLGAIIGMFGVFDAHPVLRLPLPWWIRAPFLGAWMNFVVTLFAYDSFRAVTIAAFGAGSLLQSPYWFVIEGAVVGILIGYFTTRLGGEGPKTVLGDVTDGDAVAR